MSISLEEKDLKVTVEGVEDPALFSYLTRYSPELWQAVVDLGQGGELLINPRGWITIRSSSGESLRHADAQARWISEAVRLISSFPDYEVNLPPSAKTISIVLAAGKGTRMGPAHLPKVCYPVGSRSVISRGLLIYERGGIEHHLVVVGVMGDKVIKEVQRRFPSTIFVCQGQRLGTGHAARQAAYILKAQGYRGNILVVVGDKLLAPAALEVLARRFHETDADLALLTDSKVNWPSAGRVVVGEDEQVKCILEKPDIVKSALWEQVLAQARSAGHISGQEVRQLVLDQVGDEEKAHVLLRGTLGRPLREDAALSASEAARLAEADGLYFHIAEKPGRTTRFTGAQLEARVKLVNLSVYLFKAAAFYRAVESLGFSNAQNEMYFTDVVAALSSSCQPRYRIISVPVERTEDALTYNTAEELHNIEKRLLKNTVESLARREVQVAGSRDHLWIDDLDSATKIGVGTIINAPAFIDLGDDPRMTIGRDCTVSGRIINSRLGDRCVVQNVQLENVAVGDGSEIRSSNLILKRLQVIPPGSRVVADDWSGVERARKRQRQELKRLRARYQTAIRRGRLQAPLDDYLGEVDATNVHVDSHAARAMVARGRKLKPGDMVALRSWRPVRDWLRDLHDKESDITNWLRRTYGKHSETVKRRQERLREVLHGYGKRFGYQREVIVSRAPGRLNLMGRHIDRQGGYNNQMAIDREVLMVAESRPDDQVELHHLDETNFPPVTFRMSEELARARWESWTRKGSPYQIGPAVRWTKREWDNYVKAAVTRLPEALKARPLKGMNLVVSGDIPIAAGLSSSSAMIAAAAQALGHINYLEVTPEELIDLCGEGEWYTGADGYSSDHAGVKLGKRGYVSHIKFFDFQVERNIPFPRPYSIVICRQGAPGPNPEMLEQTYRAAAASCELALLLLKQKFPEFRNRLRLLRDLDEEVLGLDTGHI